ncbi:DUF4280 domain-containing protein [Flavobacterium sp. LS1R47]|uniref:DUF4280 domain-containing protein n=1 Tax=Flavobacterium frigoritolerans TaxID=2987686 RepID=A0A9X3C9Z8_9FLAO|nr:DUF4280 domain-containing protein [Flavobacterium frigoritolerans]MCV9934318.1 DUF4280 domain-containing protein [Flavobacterium frigoritolerans]
MSQKVTQSAQLQCDKGTKLSELKVSSQDFSTFEDKFIATENDAKPNENIFPFGNCKAKYNQSCTPQTQKWEKTTQNDEINNQKIVLETSECLCKTGGKITIINKGHNGKTEAG